MDVRYSKTDFIEWKSKLESLPREIELLEKTVTENNGILSSDKDKLNELIDARIKPEKLLLKQIIAKIDLLTLPEQIPPLKSKLPPLESQLESLRGPIIQTEATIEPIKKEIRQVKLWIEIKEIQTNIHTLYEKISSLVSYRSTSVHDLDGATIELNELDQSYHQIHHEVKNLKASREQISGEIAKLKHAREGLETAARNYSSSASGGYSSSTVTGGYSSSAASGGYSSSSTGASPANSGYTSSSGDVNPSGYGSSDGSSVISTANTDFLIAEHNAKIRAKELERNDLDRLIRERERYCSQAHARKDAAQTMVNNLNAKINGYTRDILATEASRDSLLSKLDRFDDKDKVYANTHTFTFFRENLTQHEKNLSPIENNLQLLKSQRNSMLSEHGFVSDQIAKLEKRIAECEEITKTFSSVENHEQLIQRRTDQEALLTQLSTQKKDLEDGIIQRKSDIKINKSKIAVLNSELTDKRSNKYLNTLENNPVDLLNKITLSVYEEIQLFDLQHLYHQSVTVRKCLAELNSKLNYILPQQDLPLAKDSDPALARHKYYLICGLLQTELAKLNTETDGELKELIIQLLREHIIALEEAQSDYHDYESEHAAELPVMTDAFLLQSEKQTFEKVRSDFQASIEKYKLSPSPKLLNVSKLGDDLLERIDHKRKKSQEIGETFDHKYYSSLLDYGNKLLITKPDDANYAGYRHGFKQVAGLHPDDRHSPWNKVGGIALMFLGAIIVAAGVLTAILTRPIAPPLSYYMGGAVVALGVVHILGGVGLFQRGSRAGTPETLSTFKSSIKKAKNELTEDQDSIADSAPKPGSYGLKSA